ncbi:hypothetical protein L1049_018249 [Liquidambar formosana]|uniref:CCHC-type domain-containing protein n=1 Tax=Liquidambar formosana TaxID=63359 RepID=A0AAP0R9S7_LIQFO
MGDTLEDMWQRLVLTEEEKEDVGKKIGDNIGEYVDMEQGEGGVCWGKYLRIRVRLNVTRPLKRGVTVKVEGRQMWVPIKYERLPTFCYYCGILGHADKDCEQRYEEPVERREENKRAGTPKVRETTELAGDGREGDDDVGLKRALDQPGKDPTEEMEATSNNNVGVDYDANDVLESEISVSWESTNF